jgi:hypothetical protein
VFLCHVENLYAVVGSREHIIEAMEFASCPRCDVFSYLVVFEDEINSCVWGKGYGVSCMVYYILGIFVKL